MGVVWMLRQVFLQARGTQPVANDADLTPYREVLDGKRRCRLLLHLGNVSGARTHLEAALRIEPDEDETRQLLELATQMADGG